MSLFNSSISRLDGLTSRLPRFGYYEDVAAETSALFSNEEEEEEEELIDECIDDSCVPVAVMDVGGGSIKIGWAINRMQTDSLPDFCVPSVVVAAKSFPSSVSAADSFFSSSYLSERSCVGEEALQFLSSMSSVNSSSSCDSKNDENMSFDLRRPIHRGRVQNWEDMELLWNVCLDEYLRRSYNDDQQLTCLLTESPLHEPNYFEQMGEIFFESFEVDALCLQDRESMALKVFCGEKGGGGGGGGGKGGRGRRGGEEEGENNCTGIIVDVGATLSFVTPIFEGCALFELAVRIPIAGMDVDRVVLRELEVTKQPVVTWEMARIGKELYGYVAEDKDEYEFEREYFRRNPNNTANVYSSNISSSSNSSTSFHHYHFSSKEGNDCRSKFNQLRSSCVEGPEIFFSRPKKGRGGVVCGREGGEGMILNTEEGGGGRGGTSKRRGGGGGGKYDDGSHLPHHHQSHHRCIDMMHDDDDGKRLTLPEAIDDVVQKCAIDCRRRMLENIYIIGGSSLLPGFGPRLQKELKELVDARGQHSTRVRVRYAPTKSLQHYATYSGAFKFALQPNFKNFCIGKEKYNEYGSMVMRSHSFVGKLMGAER